MKSKLVAIVRAVLPKSLLVWLTKTYRLLRLKILCFWYGNPAKSLKVIAATGTNGKTTTLCLVNEILKEAGFKTAMFTTAVIELNGESYTNDLNVTVPTTAHLQQFLSDAKATQVDYVLLEATSQALDQNKIPKLNLEVAIFTNLTQDHLDYHKDMDSYAYAKSRLWHMEPKYSVVNVDSDYYAYFAQFSPTNRLVTYGIKAAATLRIDRAELYKKGSDITLEHDDKLIELGTHLLGRFNVYNVAASVATALCLEIPEDNIVAGVSNLLTIPGRQEVIDNSRGLNILVDYAHTPDALENLLDYARQTTKGSVSLVFGACGDRDQTKRPIMGKLAAEKADRIFVTDEENYTEDANQIRQMILDGVRQVDPELDKTMEISDRSKAIKAAIEVSDSGDTILVTGMGHEQYRVVDGNKVAWNDATEIRKFL